MVPKRYLIAALIISLFGMAGCQTTSKLDINAVKLTWGYGTYFIPGRWTKSGQPENYFHESYLWSDKAQQAVRDGVKIPVVLYMHGCGGQTDIETVSIVFGVHGYAVFVPDSFARPGRERLCDTGDWDYRLKIRHEEIAYALTQIRKLKWVDQSRVLLAGFSEGGNATDSWSKKGFAAHIIFGSACTNSGRFGFPAAPDGTPVLAIVGEQDEDRPGLSCGMNRTIGGSKSIVLPDVGHHVVGIQETRQAVAVFLKKCCADPVVR